MLLGDALLLSFLRIFFFSLNSVFLLILILFLFQLALTLVLFPTPSSILDRSPTHLIDEIILIDDFSDEGAASGIEDVCLWTINLRRWSGRSK